MFKKKFQVLTPNVIPLYRYATGLATLVSLSVTITTTKLD